MLKIAQTGSHESKSHWRQIMKVSRLIGGAALLVALNAGSALAIPVLGGEYPDLQKVLNNITVSPTLGVSSVNVLTDYRPYDSYWHVTATGGSVATMIIEVAGNASVNTFGIFDPHNTNNRLQLFDGAASQGAQAILSSYANGKFSVNFGTKQQFSSTTFGYYIGTPDGFFFSDTS